MSVQNEQVNKLNPKRQYPVGNCSFITVLNYNVTDGTKMILKMVNRRHKVRRCRQHFLWDLCI